LLSAKFNEEITSVKEQLQEFREFREDESLGFGQILHFLKLREGLNSDVSGGFPSKISEA